MIAITFVWIVCCVLSVLGLVDVVIDVARHVRRARGGLPPPALF